MFICGDFVLVDNTQPNRLMRVSSRDLLSLDHMRGSRESGCRPNAIFSFGWWLMIIIGAGVQIALHDIVASLFFLERVGELCIFIY